MSGGDLTALLQLQLQAEQVDEAHIAQMADDKLAALSLLLRIRLKRWKANGRRRDAPER